MKDLCKIHGTWYMVRNESNHLMWYCHTVCAAFLLSICQLKGWLLPRYKNKTTFRWLWRTTKTQIVYLSCKRERDYHTLNLSFGMGIKSKIRHIYTIRLYVRQGSEFEEFSIVIVFDDVSRINRFSLQTFSYNTSLLF